MRKLMNCELTLVEPEYRQQWIDGRIMNYNEFEWWVLNTLRIRVFGICKNECFCDGFDYLDINQSGHNNCLFIHRNQYGNVTPLYWDENDDLYFIRMN